MWELRACRGCLSINSKLEKYNNHTKKTYTCITGLAVDDNDGYPNFFCMECLALMKKIMSFRRKMRRAFYVMKEIMLKKQQITYYDITTVNRRRTNLRSTIGYWGSQSTGFYAIDNEVNDTDNDTSENVKPTIDNITETVNNESEKLSVGIQEYKPACSGHVRHVIDIEPEVKYVKVEEAVESTLQDDDIQDDDPTPCDEEHQDVTESVKEDIDMTNIFADLPESPAEESDYELEDDFFKTKQKRKKGKKETVEELLKVETSCIRSPINPTSNILSVCDIEIVPENDQIGMFEARKLREPYLSAIYKCSMCLTVYGDIETLQDHVLKHNNSSSHKHLCSVCFLRFATEEHLKIHHSENHKYIYKCRKCDGEEFYSIPDLLSHALLHPSEEASKATSVEDVFTVVLLSQNDMNLKMAHADSKFHCEKCNMRFDDEKLLKKHVKKHTKMFNCSIMCDICSTWHLHRADLNAHIMTWHMFKYECKHCSEIFFNKPEAKHHRIKHIDKIICEHCGKIIQKKGLPSHNAQSHYALTFIHDCVACGRAFASLNRMYEHQLRNHSVISINDLSTGDIEAKCKVCNIQFHSVLSYRTHAVKKQHEEAILFENTCIKCQKVFDSAEKYEEHNAMHKVKYPRKCSYCDKECKNVSLFFKHQSKKHAGLPLEYNNLPKLCELCGAKVFLMANHMRRHSLDLMSFECQYCEPPVRFPRPTPLVKHVLARHTPTPHVCAICESGFAGRQECLDHILKLHAPEKPFKCQICLRLFSHPDYLKDHAKKNHNVHFKRGSEYTSMIKQKVLVYPHMKLNLSLLKPAVLELLTVTLSSYDHTRLEVLKDPKDYIVLNSPGEVIDASTPRTIKRKWDLEGTDETVVKRKRRRRNKEDDNIADTIPIKRRIKKEKVKVEKINEQVVIDNAEALYVNNELGYDDTIVNDFDEVVNKHESVELVNEDEGGEFVEEDDVGELVNEDEGVEFVEEDEGGELVNEDEGGEFVNEDDDLVINAPLQVFEVNNQKFVFIKGVMYKVEMDD